MAAAQDGHSTQRQIIIFFFHLAVLKSMILCVFQSRRYDSRTTIFSPEGKFHFTDALQAVTYHSITLSMSELETVFLHKINELTLENNLCETNGLTICRTLVPSGTLPWNHLRGV